MAAVAADPAVVSAKPHNQTNNRPANAVPDAPVKPKYQSSATMARAAKNAETGEQSFPDVDAITHVIIHTTVDDEHVAIPRASARNVPGLTIPDAPAAPPAPAATNDDETPAAPPAIPVQVIDMGFLHSAGLIAVNQWIEKKGVSGKSSTAFTNPITHTDIAQITTDDWEKEFSSNLLKTGEAIIGCINFAERNNMTGLREFGIVALSCALRGKTAHQMCVAMGHNEDKFADETIAQAKDTFKEVAALAKVNN